MIPRYISYDGIDLSSLVVVESVRRSLLNAKSVWGEVAGRPDYLMGLELEAKEITVTLRVIRWAMDDLNATMFELNRIFYRQGLCELRLWDRDGYHDLVTLSGPIDWDRTRTYGLATVTFRSPYAYSFANEETVITDGAVEIKGTHAVEPIITATFATGIKPRVTDVTSGRVWSMDYTLQQTMNITVDHGRREITSLIPNPYQYVSLDSRYFSLEPGTHTITTNGTGLEVRYKERWLG